MIRKVHDEGSSGSRDQGSGSDRYRIEALLGQGGMAVVHLAIDRATGRRIALKRMRITGGNPDSNEKYVAMFEREYLTLVGLSHPRIVEVYDYGVDDEGPYYTMELLDGGDLQSLSPVDWRKACAYARDVCSALALLHSRRMVYRDLSPRNVRCTSDGLAKLIDFGAMTPMGPSRELVGTLPYVPPEAVHQQALDARTDLYALGATLYYTLVQRHAYPARDVVQLRDFWRSRPRRPSELVPAIPEALDNLIMDLMHLDPAVRPANASEVMARLGAIAGLRASEQILVSQAYLSNPTLVGREGPLTQSRKLMLRAVSGRGIAMMVKGGPGLGRSRFLDACVLEAKLAGLTVLRADMLNAQEGSYGVVRALGKQLIEAVGPLALDVAEPVLPLLGYAIPALVKERPDITLERVDDPQQHHRRVQQALRHWLIGVSRTRALMLAIDDLPRIDESSAACVALLAQHVSEHGIVIATSVGDDDVASSPVRGAVELLATSSTTLELEPLTLELTEQLLSSVFGDVPNLKSLSRYLQDVTSGNPRDIMRLAQHLVTEQVIQYQAGAWSVPLQLDARSLPASMADALGVRVAHLSREARALALAFALEPTQRFSFADCSLLSPAANAVQIRQALDELVEAEVLLYASERYSLRQRGWAVPIAQTFDASAISAVHLALAAMFESRSEAFRTAEHLLKGGAFDPGLDALLKQASESEQRTDVDANAFHELLASLPPDWLGTYELGLRLIRERGRPARQRDVLLSRLGGLIAHAVSETDGYALIAARLEQLRSDSGLDLWAAQPSDTDPGTRLKTALEQATIRFHKTPEHDRVLDPGTAIKQLPKAVLSALGTIAFTSDFRDWLKLPPLSPLSPLSPALGVVQQLVDGVGARISGRTEEAIAKYEALLERMAQPDRAGLTPVHYHSTQTRVILGIGTLEATMGKQSCLARAEQVERDANYALQAMFIRHLYHVWQGDSAEAARCKQQIELLRIESNAQIGFEGQHLLSELAAYALAEDMTRVKRATDAVVPRAAIHRAWVPVLHFGRGEYQRIRGDFAAALVELERALSLMDDGHHQIWANAAGAHLRALIELDRQAEASALGEAYLQTAVENGVGYQRNYIRMPLALALSKAGSHDAATRLAQAVIDELLAIGSSGLNLASAYEVRARIDLETGDRESFERHATLCAGQWRSGERRLLGAKYQRLVQFGSEADPSVLDEVPIVTQFTSTLENCHNANQRARCGLEFLGRQSGALGGALYTNTVVGLVRAATFGEVEIDDEMDDWAMQYFAREVEEEDDGTEAFSDPPAAKAAGERTVAGHKRVVPVLLTHQSERGYAITGVALLVTLTETPFIYPSRIAAELSKSVALAGDVVPIYT